jgi:hypothetical protein
LRIRSEKEHSAAQMVLPLIEGDGPSEGES